MLNEKSKHQFIKEIGDIALFATQIPLFIFTNLFHQRFEKHSILESTLEILQQLYIQMETEPYEFAVFPGALSTYTLRCIRCGQPVTLAGSIGETLLYAPTAMLYHWNIIETHEKQNHRETMLMPLLFTFYDNYIKSLNSFQEGLNWMEDLKICQIQPNTNSFCFVRLLRLIWQIPRSHYLTTQNQALFLLSLWFLNIYLKPSTYTRIAVMKNRTLNHPSHY
jgi:hypothetical protein